MELNNVELINTEIGKIPVIVNEVITEGNSIFKGKMIYSEMHIFIETSTKKSCLIGLTNLFELHMDIWLEKQLSISKTIL